MTGLTIPAPIKRELGVSEIDWELPAAPMDDVSPSTDGGDVLTDAILDALAYRTVAQEGLHALHRLTRQLDRLTEQHRQLCAEYREFRARVMRKADAT